MYVSIFFLIYERSVKPAWLLTSSAWEWCSQIKVRSPSQAELARQADVVKCDDLCPDRRQSPDAFPWVQWPLAAPNPPETNPPRDLQHDPARSCVPNPWTWKLCCCAPKAACAGPRTDWWSPFLKIKSCFKNLYIYIYIHTSKAGSTAIIA